MLNEGTIIAKATPSGISAISVIRLSGTDSIKMVSSCFKAKSGKLLANQKSHTIDLGTIYDKEREIDEYNYYGLTILGIILLLYFLIVSYKASVESKYFNLIDGDSLKSFSVSM